MFGFGKGKIEIQLPKFNFSPGEMVEGIIVLNVTSSIKSQVESNLDQLGLSHLGMLVLNTNGDGSGVDKFCFSDISEIRLAAKSFQTHLEKNFTKIKKIHLFVSLRGVMMVQLAIHCRLMNIEVNHYEYGRNDPDQKEKRYFYVFSSEK